MKRSSLPFQTRLLLYFLVVGLVPLAFCVTIMISIFRTSVAASDQSAAEARLAAMTEELSERVSDCDAVLARLAASRSLAVSLADPSSRESSVYQMIYSAAAPLLRQAEFSVYDDTGNIRYTTGEVGSLEMLPVEWGLLRAAREEGSLVCDGVSPHGGEAGAVQLCRMIPGENGAAGYAIAKLSGENIARLPEGEYGAGSGVLVLNAFWEPIYASPTVEETSLAAELRSALLAGKTPFDDQGEFLFEARKEPISGLVLVLCRLKPLTRGTIQNLFAVAGFAVVLSFLLCLLFSMRFSSRTIAPIRSLNSAMRRMEEGDLAVRMEMTDADELGQLAGRFNRMAEKLETNLRDSIRQQQDLGDARIRMMQAQLNPHFLYNTLDTLKWLGKINHVEEVSTISANLADILRRSISADRFVRLGDELALLDRYVEIQRIRFPDKFTYHAEVPDDLLDATVPKLMLQPLVENAVIHGFEDGRFGHVEVTAQRSGDMLILTVCDNGVGMSEESRERFLRRTAPQAGRPGHLGLYNVDAILRLHYGEASGLQLISSTSGTVLRATLPMRFAARTPDKGESDNA